MTLRTAIRRATERRRAERAIAPLDQVLRAHQRPLVQHVHHQHLTSTTLRLSVSVPVQVVSTTHPIRVHVVPGGGSGPSVRLATAYPGVVLRTAALTSVAATVAGHPETRSAAPVPPSHGPRAAAPALTHVSLPARPRPARAELVHRQPTPSPGGTTREWPAGARPSTSAPRPGWQPTEPDRPFAPGATALTDADVPRVVDHVVRELDRRVVASRERRGWTS